MRVQIKTDDVRLTPADHDVLWRRIRSLEARLEHVEPDLINLQIVLEAQPRRTEYTGHVRLVVMNQVLAARRNQAKRVRTLLHRAFDDLEEQLERFNAGLRREVAWERKRGARSTTAFRAAEQELTEERALLDRALAGERAAFDRVAETQLAGVRKVIFDSLSAAGHDITTRELDTELEWVLARAYERLDRKPERWTLHGWLAHVARRELRGRVHA
jgi:ribosome-associated translation inhibitor RaiA